MADFEKHLYFYDVELDQCLVKIKECGTMKHRLPKSPFDNFPNHDKLILGYGVGVNVDFDHARKRGVMIELDPENDPDRKFFKHSAEAQKTEWSKYFRALEWNTNHESGFAAWYGSELYFWEVHSDNDFEKVHEKQNVWTYKDF